MLLNDYRENFGKVDAVILALQNALHALIGSSLFCKGFMCCVKSLCPAPYKTGRIWSEDSDRWRKEEASHENGLRRWRTDAVMADRVIEAAVPCFSTIRSGTNPIVNE